MEAHQVTNAKYSTNDEGRKDLEVASTVVGSRLARGIVRDGAKQVGHISQAQCSQDRVHSCIPSPNLGENGIFSAISLTLRKVCSCSASENEKTSATI
jgi:hypothetical protein